MGFSAQPAAAIKSAEPNRGTSVPINASSSIPRGLIFGAVSGLMLGGLAGAASCWIVVANDFLWNGVIAGVALGLFGGATIGLIERWRRGPFARPDVATLVGGIFGFAPAVLSFTLGMSSVRSSFSVYRLVGAVFIFPAVGILVGASLDRAYEAGCLGKKWDALKSAILGVAACLGLLWLIVANPSGMSADDLVRPVSQTIYGAWRDDPEWKDAVVKNVKLQRERDGFYRGSFEADLPGKSRRFSVEVKLSGDRISANWIPLDE